MSESKTVSYWIPLILAIAFLVLGVILPRYVENLPTWVQQSAIGLSLLLIVTSGVLAYTRTSSVPPLGGRGGSAKASGEDNEAVGGRGGDAGRGYGGDGGKAVAKGRRSVAKGGAGGKGG